ncbi:MAG: PilZ domain-containing protein [Acidobacteriota bacterium]
MEERRRSPRNKVTIEVNGKGRATLEVSVLDVSEHGLLVESSTPVRPGGMCEIAIEVPGGERMIRAEVRRCRAQMVETEKGPRIVYHAGLEFDQPAAGGEEVKNLISELCGTGTAPGESHGKDGDEPRSREDGETTKDFRFAM